MSTKAENLPPQFSLTGPSNWNRRRVLVILSLLAPGLLLIGGALIWPFLKMAYLSIHSQGDTPFYTLDHYTDFLREPYFLGIALRTFALAFIVTFICAVVAYPAAWFVARADSRWKHLIFLGIISPLLVSIVVRTIGWTIILGEGGLINSLLMGLGITDEPLSLMRSFWSVVVAMVHVMLPFMILCIASVVGKIDPSYAEASAVLGANPIKTFFKITLPLSVNGLAAGSVIVFCLTIGSYIVPLWLGRGNVQVLAITIYEQMIVLVDWPTGSAISVLLTLGMTAALVGYGLVLRKYTYR